MSASRPDVDVVAAAAADADQVSYIIALLVLTQPNACCNVDSVLVLYEKRKIIMIL